MKKGGWLIVLAAIAATLVVGFSLSEAVTGAQQPTRRNRDSAQEKVIGTIVPEVQLAGLQAVPVGIKTTINIPAAAFIAEDAAPGSYNPEMGYVESSPAWIDFLAPVVFPKGAKKILHVDFYVMDGSTAGGTAVFSFFKSDPNSTGGASRSISFTSQYFDGKLVKYLTYPTDKNIYSGYTYYIKMGSQGGGAFLYGVIIYYSTL
jgi:hypothetical protein